MPNLHDAALRPTGLAARIACQMERRRADPDAIRVKVNLYTAAETAAVAEASARLAAAGRPPCIDCLMVGDSYLMTHLGRPSTRIEGAEEQAQAFRMMLGLVREVAEAVPRVFPDADRPWVMGDLPDGAASGAARAADSVARMIDAGADAVKLELSSPEILSAAEMAASAGRPVALHIGYTPQSRENRRYGSTEAEALDLIAEARRARDAGAVAIVLERVDPAVHALLCRPHPRGLPVYAIFSGQAPHGGQSLNVFDSVVRPDRAMKAFPPTATLDRADFPAGYTHAAIADHFARLLVLAQDGGYPKPHASVLPADAAERLARADVWT